MQKQTDCSNPCPYMYSIEQKHVFDHIYSFDQNDTLQYTIWVEKALEYTKNIQFWTKAYFGIYSFTKTLLIMYKR